MDVYVTIVRYNDSYQTTLKEVWFNEEAARNRCKMPLYHSGGMFEIESYELYKVQLNTPWEVGGNRGDTEIAVYGECGLTKAITLWDWTDTHNALILVGIEKQDWIDMNLSYTED